MKKHRENRRLSLGHRIRAIRKAKGWTQEELGAKADISYKFIGEIERGQQNPSFDVLVKIANGFGIELSELFLFEPEIRDRESVEKSIEMIIRAMPEGDLRLIFSVLRGLYPQAK